MKKKTALLNSIIALLLCLAMFVGSTFAWFTDSVTSGRNTITAGNLDVELYCSASAAGPWTAVDENTNAFGYDNWEPGFTKVVYFRVVNAGSLALKYKLTADVYAETPGINKEGNSFKLSQYLRTAIVTADVTRDEVLAMTGEPLGTLSLKDAGVLDTDTHQSDVVGLAIWMPTTVGNEANHNGTQPSIEFGINLLATQYTYENDSFGNEYDADAEFPAIGVKENVTGSTTVAAENGIVFLEATISTNTDVKATIPAGVAVDGNELTLSVSKKGSSDSNVTPGEDEAMAAIDVHIDGVSVDNTVPIIVELGAVLPIGMNMGNVTLYHVENGTTNPMTQVSTLAELDAHNEFYYDPATGKVTVAMATFSEVDIYANTENEWNGNFDYSWYDDSTKSEYIIANADQLAAFGAIVGGMSGNGQNSFTGKTVKLLADINLGDENDAKPGQIFYPIGYYNNTGSYAKSADGAVTSDLNSFEGTFDGNGHTVMNFYQNTWDMFGDYNDGYSGTPNHYKDAMGLFGYVVNGTVKNLVVKNFSSDGEFTPTGVIAAYAVNSTFENIEIFNCNPRVYNTGNGGIVGIGGLSSDNANQDLTFTNITVDNSNKISALWGSWDVACGGLMGMFRGNGNVRFENCHVAAQIDVFNDVCGNYQYYWYRYAGMMIGSIRKNVTDEDGYVRPDMTNISASNCTVHFGNWNNYYYCELVANSLASYTHDHQFSRLEQISSLDAIKSGDTWTKAGNFLLISGDTKECYHIVNKDGVLTQHNHADAGEEVVDGKTVLKENNQIVYLPFNQLFQGDGWGVKHIPVYDDKGGNAFAGITILDREVGDSVFKFAAVNGANGRYFLENDTVTVGELFQSVQDRIPIDTNNVQVTVAPANAQSQANAVYTANTGDWTKGTLKFGDGLGALKITINDYNFCRPTTITVKVVEYTRIEVEPKNPCFPTGEHNFSQGDFKVTVFRSDGSSFEASNGYTVDYSQIKPDVSDTYTVTANYPGAVNPDATCQVKLKPAEAWIDLGQNYTGIVEIAFDVNVSWGGDNARFWLPNSTLNSNDRPNRQNNQVHFNINPGGYVYAQGSYVSNVTQEGYINSEVKAAEVGKKDDKGNINRAHILIKYDIPNKVYTIKVGDGPTSVYHEVLTGQDHVRYLHYRSAYRITEISNLTVSESEEPIDTTLPIGTTKLVRPTERVTTGIVKIGFDVIATNANGFSNAVISVGKIDDYINEDFPIYIQIQKASIYAQQKEPAAGSVTLDQPTRVEIWCTIGTDSYDIYIAGVKKGTYRGKHNLNMFNNFKVESKNGQLPFGIKNITFEKID